MLNKGIGARAADEQGRTLLHHAAASNAVLVIDLLLERGASFDFKDAKGYTVRPVLVEEKEETPFLLLPSPRLSPHHFSSHTPSMLLIGCLATQPHPSRGR